IWPVQMAHVGQDAEIGIGGKAIGSEGDTDAAFEKMLKRMRRVTERDVCSGAINDAAIVRDIRGRRQIIAMNKEGWRQAVQEVQHVLSVFCQASRFPHIQIAQE